MRLTKSEYEQLKRPSAGLSMSACTPLRLFGHNEAKRGTRGKFPVKDQQAHRQYENTRLQQSRRKPAITLTASRNCVLRPSRV